MHQVKVSIKKWITLTNATTRASEIDWYDIDDIDVLKTFHSISRSKSVTSITNDTDPDGKTKIIIKLRIKLPYRYVADILEVKVNDRAEANILTIAYFQIYVPSQTR